ncbi:hypothetical protein KDA_34130 [Dictyobacter alpinus]|uniref:CAAX prenyl protease 2/Lysostaphin resistance protein A-like domain-containing protein n=1 Tax=Dictyobacter alpinus TaxID=2014873 RepID=A0A402B9D8_9CHLR|nr:CPBP family glutamic-type intramembrane protease [Dictyobacter alpinus]GCE27929.1 hypothetical protein KDA_34130 [Dictyobacter alpinus]
MVNAGMGELVEIILPVRDMNTQVAFYRDMLGLHVYEPEAVQDFRDFYDVKLYTGTCMLVLHTVRGEESNSEHAPKLVFRVADLRQSRELLQEQQIEMGEIRSPENGLLICDGKDPEGNIFSLESSDEQAQQPIKVTSQPGRATTYVSINSRRGRSITLLRDNKFVIALEVAGIILLNIARTPLNLVSLLTVFLVIMALLWLRGSSWSQMGLRTPLHWRSTLLTGLIGGLVLFLMSTLVFSPIIETFVHSAPNTQLLDTVRGNPIELATTLISIWTSVAFGEELIYRGYLFNRIADVFNDSGLGWTIAVFGQAIIFGLAHIYQGLAGILLTTAYGVMAGLLYLISRRNLWPCVIAHGLVDTISTILRFTGMA